MRDNDFSKLVFFYNPTGKTAKKKLVQFGAVNKLLSLGKRRWEEEEEETEEDKEEEENGWEEGWE